MEQRLGSEARTSPRSGFLEVPSVVLFLAGEGLNQGAMIADQRGSRRRAQRHKVTRPSSATTILSSLWASPFPQANPTERARSRSS